MSSTRESLSLTRQLEPAILRLATESLEPEERRRASDDLIAMAHERIEHLTRTILRDHPKVRRREVTGDIAQTVVLKIYRYLDGPTPPNDGRHFLRIVARMIRFTILELAEQHRRNPGMSVLGVGVDRDESTSDHLGAAFDPAEATQGPADLAEWTEFHRSVEQLPEDDREVFELRYYNGLSVEAVAELVGVDPRTVKRRWSRARLKLQELWDQGPTR